MHLLRRHVRSLAKTKSMQETVIFVAGGATFRRTMEIPSQAVANFPGECAEIDAQAVIIFNP
jgi:hypothetical protein